MCTSFPRTLKTALWAAALSFAVCAPAQQTATTPASENLLGASKGTGQASGIQPLDAKAEKQHQADIDFDTEVGRRAAEQVEKEGRLSTNADYQARVQRVGEVIAKIADTNPVKALWGDPRFNPFHYTYKVLQGKDVNAFSLPGGHIYVYEGLMREIESDDELAGVLAHETAHAAFRHVATLERKEQRMSMLSIPALVAAILVGHAAGAEGVGLMNQAIASGWSVQAEEAADYGGMQYMLRSPYKPTGMLTFMERLALQENVGLHIDWGIYRDHPPGPERAAMLQKEMEDAHVPIRRSEVTTSFRTTDQMLPGGKAQISFGKHPLVTFGGPDALARADAAVVELNRFFDSVPEMFELQENPDGGFWWKGKALFHLTRDDAAANGMRLDELQDSTLKNIRISLFGLGFHVWASHG